MVTYYDLDVVIPKDYCLIPIPIKSQEQISAFLKGAKTGEWAEAERLAK